MTSPSPLPPEVEALIEKGVEDGSIFSEWSPAKSVSYSSMTLHRQCPQAYVYRYVRGLTKPDLAVSRDLGHWWHLLRAMDSLERGASLGSLRDVPLKLKGGDDYQPHFVQDEGSTVSAPTYSSTLEGRAKKAEPSIDLALWLATSYWDSLGGEAQDAWLEVLGEPLADRLLYMAEEWQAQWHDDLKHEAPLGVEVRFNRDLPGTDGARLPGVVDEVYLDTRRNLLVVRDHKTSKSLPSQESADDLSDSQLHLYAWGAAPTIASWGQGSVRAISYDRARTAKPKEPLVTKTGGTLSKSVTDYDLRTYLAWANGPDGQGVPWGEEGTYFQSGPKKGQPKFGHYQAEEKVIERLSSPAGRSIWFQRTLTPVNRNVIRAHLAATIATQRQAERTLAYFDANGEAPRNFNRQLCGWCDYAPLCRAEMMGGSDGDYPLEQFGLTHRTRRA